MILYTADAVDRVRDFARRGWPPGAVCCMLGWEMEFLRRVAKNHQISFAVPKKKKPQVLDLEEITWDGKRASFRGKSVLLPGTEGRIFSYIFRTPGEPRTLNGIERGAHVTKRNVAPGIDRVRVSLKVLGLTLSRWGYDIELA